MRSAGRVDGVEQHALLVDFAQSRSAAIPELSSLGFCTFIHADAFRVELDGQERYDRIYVGGGISPVHSDHFRELLAVGGVLVAPRVDELIKVERLSELHFKTSTLAAVRFTVRLFFRDIFEMGQHIDA